MKRINTKNRLLSFVITVIMATGVFSVMPVAVSAADGTISLVRITAPESIFPGSVVTLDVVMAENPGFGMIQYLVQYDSPYVTNWTRNNMDFPTTILEWTHRIENGQRTQFMTAAQENEMRNGIMSRYTFRISEDAPVGVVIPFTFAKEGSLDAVTIQPIVINVAGESMPLTVVEAPNLDWVTDRFRAIVTRGLVLGDITGDGTFGSTDVLLTRQIGNPGHSRTIASTLADYPDHDMVYLYNLLRSVQNGVSGLPDALSERVGQLVTRGFVLGDITGDGTFGTVDVLLTRQIANPGHSRTASSTLIDYPNHDEAYLFLVLRGLLGII
ncbi:MAG: hypothetical protein FWE27_06770 [Defluviitaleaceae bacterium]|nr:hypothetical protein [Defluviitaleaceae bacterium]